MALAGRHVRYHYDLGNDLYRLFLDDTMTYSCAVFTAPGESLQEAQRTKHRMICGKLRLRPGDRLLEIGCGWGAFAMVAAGEYGAHVTGVTLSREQHDLATRRIAEAGLTDRIDVRLQDYRTLRGRWDVIASTEMIEAIGHRELPTFFRTCDRLLGDDGLVCIQAIAVPDRRYDRYRRSRDWMTEYIFPGATVPSMRAMVDAMTDASELMVHGVEDIGIHYAETLRRWRVSFEERRDEVLALGFDEAFIRAWRFYLAGCEAAFRTRSIHDYQLVLTRPFNGRLPGGVDAGAR
jgi:cyclopropane-fatty-acyl-phospholipid synthase